MAYDPDVHHRRSIRLKGFDYSQPGAYFITICTQGRACLFGEAGGQKLIHSAAGEMVLRWWHELSRKFPFVELDERVLMPNHLHGLLWIKSNLDGDVRPLSDVVQWLKTMTTNEFIRGVKEQGWPRFNGKLWQRDYFERIVRDDWSVDRIREYI